jgi:hypothetical protein
LSQGNLLAADMQQVDLRGLFLDKSGEGFDVPALGHLRVLAGEWGPCDLEIKRWL